MRKSDEIRLELVDSLKNYAENAEISTNQLAVMLRTNQSKFKKLLAGETSNFTVDRLINYLNIIGYEIEVTVYEREN